MSDKLLCGKVAVVAGATRGAGRGIAMMLGEAGAKVYVTGRSVRGNPSAIGRIETIEETADLVDARGGLGIPVKVDHTDEEQVKTLFERVRNEQNGQLDILVNDIWGGDPLTEFHVPLWNQTLDKGFFLQKQAVHSHIITSRYGLPMMVERNQGLVIEITDGIGYGYRPTRSIFYSLAKISAIHLAEAMAEDFRIHNLNITSLALTPGWVRSEAMLEGFGVKEENWRDAIKKEPGFARSESTCYVGRAIVALACDQNVISKSGKAFSSGDLAHEYGFMDLDGTQPYWEWK
jgi:NAD(P)-dependent dehydrogenase (short-subunit alcohol dehydrogenase family)